MFTAVGCTAGIVPHLLATVLGLAAVLHASAVAFQVLKFAGVAYLFCIAWATWRDKSAFVLGSDSAATGSSGASTATCRCDSASRAISLMAKAFRKAVIESPRVQSWLRSSFAAAFAGLGVNWALSDK